MDYTNTANQTHHDDNTIRMPQLLFWQYLVVYFVIGIVATRFFNLALCAGILLFFVLYFVYTPLKRTTHKNNINSRQCSFLPTEKIQNKKQQEDTFVLLPLSSNTSSYFSFCLRTFLCILCAIIAFYYTPFMNPHIEEWENQKTTELPSHKVHFDAFNDPMKSMYLQGKIIRTQALPYGRLRFFLEEVKPLTGYHIQKNEEKSEAPNIPQILSLTWDRAPYSFMRPVVGQNIIVKARVRETYGDIGDYWAIKNVWYTAYTYKSEDIFWTGKGNIFAKARESLRYAFVENIFPHIRDKNSESKEEISTNNQKAKGIESQSKAILPALLFGDRFYISALTMDTFNSANLLHSLALSGQHLALTSVLAALFVSFILVLRPQILTYTSRRQLIFYTSIPLTLAYVFLGSAPLSLLRACIMFMFAGFFWVFARTITLLDCLFFALAFFCIIDPASIFDLGVQLSFTSVFTIAFFMPIIRLPLRIFQKQEHEITKQKSSIRKTLQNLHSETNLTKTTLLKKYFTLSSLFFKRTSILTLRAFCTLFLISFFIQITNLPFIITYFGKASYFFILNILWLPSLAFIVLPFAAFALILTIFQLLIIELSYSSFLLDFINTCIHTCIAIASYPPKIMLAFLVYLQSIGFDPFIQFYKPHKISFLTFYAILFICLYSWFYYQQIKSNTIRVSFYKRNSVFNSFLSNFFSKYDTKNRIKFSFSKILVTGICIFFFCLSPYIYQHFFLKSHFTLTVFDVGQGQSVLIENSLEDSPTVVEKNIQTQKNSNYNPILKGRILIDAGGPRSPRFNVGRDIIAHKLTQNKSPKLTYAIASHDDADHINGFAHIMQYFDVPAFAEPYIKQTHTSNTRKLLDKILEKYNIPIEKLGMGDIINLGNGFALQVLHPPYPLDSTKPIFIDIDIHSKTSLTQTQMQEKSFPATRPLATPFKKYSSNNSSLVLRLVKEGKGLALICGDVEKDVLEELVKYEKEDMWTYNPSSQYSLDTYADKHSPNLINWSLGAHVLILAHHGSINSYLPHFYDLVRPHTVIASAGKYNRYGFPAKEIEAYFKKESFENNKINFLVTARDGDIMLSWDEQKGTLHKQ